MKKYFIWAMVSIVVAFAGCSDDEVDSPPFLIGNSQGVIDGKTYSVLGLGNGCDITQTIGKGNVKEQILDLELLMKDKGIELDDTPAPYIIFRKGNNYAEMTNALNKCLAGEMNFELPEVAFGRNLYDILLKYEREMDIYEYGACMYVNKLASLAIKSQFHGQIKDYVTETAWSEINGTDADNRADKAAIKKLFEKYGTHVATKTFYGSMYQYSLVRERNEWESDMLAQLDIGLNHSQVSLPESGLNVNGNEFVNISDADDECFKNSSAYISEYGRRIGGNNSFEISEDWWKSATLDDLSTCVLLGYSLNVEGGEDSGLIPLYELLDDGDARKNAMKEALNEYVQENKIVLTSPGLVLVDAFGKHYEDGNAPEYLYQDRNGNKLKYFRLDEEIFQHVRGITEGEFYFYYSLGYLYEKEAVVDMKFDDVSDLVGDWHTRGDHADAGVTGNVRNRYLCVKYEHSNDVSENEFVTGFGVKVDGKIAAISKYSGTDYNWIQNGDLWYKGLIHDDVYCIYTKDRLKGY